MASLHRVAVLPADAAAIGQLEGHEDFALETTVGSVTTWTCRKDPQQLGIAWAPLRASQKAVRSEFDLSSNE
jgi:hypothetical protein